MEGERARVLLVEDDPIVRGAVRRTLQRSGYDVVDVGDAGEALDVVTQGFDVALLDIGLPDGRSGIDLLPDLKARDPHLEAVIFTGDASAEIAGAAYRAGAVEFFEKPISDWNRFHHVLQRAAKVSRLSRENAQLLAPSADVHPLRRLLVGASAAMDGLRSQVSKLGPRQVHVLLLGPSGSGKTHVAHALHVVSGRKGPFEAVQIASRSESIVTSELFGHEKGAFSGADARHAGVFERNANGTVLLDEIGDLSTSQQALLLQVLEERVVYPVGGARPVPVTARIVAATNKDVEAMVLAGTFRSDLANRLGIRVEVPGLAARTEDIPRLVYHFLEAVNAREGLAIRSVPEAVMERLMSADWSRDNLRGLRTVVEELAIFAEGDALAMTGLRTVLRDRSPMSADGAELPDAWRALPFRDFKEAVLLDYVGRYVRALLADTEGNVSAAARIAGLHPPNFRRLMSRFDVDAT